MGFTPPSYNKILQSMVNSYKATTTNQGYDINVDPSSEPYLRYAVAAGQFSVLYNLVNAVINSKLIASATGSDLDDITGNFGLVRKPAVSSQGSVQLLSLVPQTLTVGLILTGPNSLQYKVSVGGVYSPNANVPVSSVNTGSNTNLASGIILTWQTSFPNMQSTAPVSIAITGGQDAEDDNTLRNRLNLQLQSPPQGANSKQLSNLAVSSDALVQEGFVYSNFNGAGTQLLALTAYQTSSYIGRDVPHLNTDGYVPQYGLNVLQPGLKDQLAGHGCWNAYTLPTANGFNLSQDISTIYGQLPGTIANPFATVITSVNNQPADMAILMELPYPVGAPVNGFGGGWLNYSTFPNPDGHFVNNYCQITAITDSTHFTLAAPSTGLVHTNGNGSTVSAQAYNAAQPIPNLTKISWVNRTTWQVMTAKVIAAVDNGNDTWTITVDSPFAFPAGETDFYGNNGLMIGDLIFPASVNATAYLTNVLQQFAQLGPGEVTSSTGLLALGAARFPYPGAQFPQTVGVQLERALVVNNGEVISASCSTHDTYNTAYVAPPTNSPPNIWVPRNIGFYDKNSYNFGK